MNARTLLAAAAALAAATTAALATPNAVASTVTVRASATAAPAAVLAGSGQPGGVLPGRFSAQAGTGTSSTGTSSTGPSISGAAASCKEPNCDVSYHGGPVIRAPRVYLYFWGPKWKTAATEKTAMNYLTLLYKGLGASPDTWSLTAAQYGSSKGHPTFGRALYAGAKIDTSTPPASVSLKDLVDEADKGRKAFGIGVGSMENSIIVVAGQSGTCYSVETDGGKFVGNCGKDNGAKTGYCAFHSYDLYKTGSTLTYLPWVNLPFQLDAGTGCGEGYVNKPGVYDGFSLAAGHETMESITDPMITAWYDAKDEVSGGGEVADKCAWGGVAWGGHDPIGDIALKTGKKFAMQSLWSNAAGACVMDGKLTLRVATPAAQKSVVGAHVSLQITAKLSGRAGLTFKATGLPRGLSIGKSGKITGTVKSPKKAFYPKIKVSYYAGSTTIKFKWVVS